MQVLSIVSTFAPYKYGGAEVSARNLMNWALKKGHDVAAYTMAEHDHPAQRGEDVDGLKLWRLPTEKPYAYWQNLTASVPQKLEFYLKDHFDPRNSRRMGDVLDHVKPDVIFMHVLAGLGWNACSQIARRDIPTIYFMHDLNLVCANGGMFKAGETCKAVCTPCRGLSSVRFGAVSKIPRVGFCSPSQANFDKGAEFLPLRERPNVVVPNPNVYPRPQNAYQASDTFRVVFVGRLHFTKGVHILLEACARLADRLPISLTVIGGGLEADALQAQWGDKPWVTFTGVLDHQTISDTMANSDVLCAPSIWPENYPGVVAHALGQGVPVVGTRIGGIPELVRPGENGLLVPPDDIAALSQALEQLASDPAEMAALRERTVADMSRFDPERNAEQILAFAARLIEGAAAA